jgi:hypothetical protein
MSLTTLGRGVVGGSASRNIDNDVDHDDDDDDDDNNNNNNNNNNNIFNCQWAVARWQWLLCIYINVK